MKSVRPKFWFVLFKTVGTLTAGLVDVGTLRLICLSLEHPDYPVDVKTLRANPLCEVGIAVIAATAFALPSIPVGDNNHALLHMWLLLNFVDSAEKNGAFSKILASSLFSLFEPISCCMQQPPIRNSGVLW